MLKNVNETLTWKQVVLKYANKGIYLKLGRTPFWSWKNREIPEFCITGKSDEIRENYMTVWDWQDYFGKQNVALFKRNTIC